MARVVKTIEVLTSGGDVPGVNAATRVVVRTATNKGLKVGGVMRGYTDLLGEEIVDMKPTGVSDVINRGGTILYTARRKEFAIAEGQRKGVGICRKHGIGGMVIIGEDGSFRDAGKLSALGINTIGLPGAIDLDIARTGHTIGFDTTVSTAMETIDKIHDTLTFHERCSTVEAMGHNTGYIALWRGAGDDAENILLPERYGDSEQALINRIINNHRRGKKHNIVVNAEGIDYSGSMTRHIEIAMGIETRATILGHMQRDGTSTCKGRVYVSIMGAKVVELLAAGKSNHLAVYKHGGFVNFDIREALNMIEDVPEEQYEIAKMPIR